MLRHALAARGPLLRCNLRPFFAPSHAGWRLQKEKQRLEKELRESDQRLVGPPGGKGLEAEMSDAVGGGRAAGRLPSETPRGAYGRLQKAARRPGTVFAKLQHCACNPSPVPLPMDGCVPQLEEAADKETELAGLERDAAERERKIATLAAEVEQLGAQVGSAGQEVTLCCCSGCSED